MRGRRGLRGIDGERARRGKKGMWSLNAFVMFLIQIRFALDFDERCESDENDEVRRDKAISEGFDRRSDCRNEESYQRCSENEGRRELLTSTQSSQIRLKVNSIFLLPHSSSNSSITSSSNPSTLVTFHSSNCDCSDRFRTR